MGVVARKPEGSYRSSYPCVWL